MMVAIFTGSGAGFERGSGSVLGAMGLLGSSSMGRGGEQVMLNAATGNLLIGKRDEFLVGRGPDAAISRTYNSLGGFDGDNNDNWRQSTQRKITVVGGAVNQTGSSIKRHSEDGSETVYSWNGSAYVATDGGGAYDKIVRTGGGWTWSDGEGQITETYLDHAGEARIVEQFDTSGKKISFTYDGDRLSRVTTADGGYVQYHWMGNNISQIVTAYKDLATGADKQLSRTRYAYDHLNRLSTVTVDLSPEDGSVADGKTYTTSYAYQGDTKLVASIQQTDGSSLDIAYDGYNRVASMTQVLANGEMRKTSIAYAADRTSITDPAGQVTTLVYNADKSLRQITAPPAIMGAMPQVLSFAYNAQGDLVGVTDSAGATASYRYDERGNAIGQTDRLGNVVMRTFGARNELLSETRTGSDRSSAAAHHVSRYVYDAQNRLRWEISAEGRVTQYRHDDAAHTLSIVQYPDSAYQGEPTDAALQAWQGAMADKSGLKIDKIVYDARGNVAQQISYGTVDAHGNPVETAGFNKEIFTYDQAGQLLMRVSTPQAADGMSSGGPAAVDPSMLGRESYVYDGMGRVVASTDGNGGTSRIMFDDAATRTVMTLANGFVQTSTYDKAGELVGYTQSGDFVTSGDATYKYDKLGRLRMATDMTGLNSYHVYDGAGRKVADVNNQGHVVEYRYDVNDRLIATVRHANALEARHLAMLAHPDAVVEMETRADSTQPDNRIRPAASPDDIWTWQVYDRDGRIVQAIDGDGSFTSYHYDASSRLVATIAYANKLPGEHIHAMRAMPPMAPVAMPAASANDRTARTFYDRDGLVVGMLDGEGFLTRATYDAAGQRAMEVAGDMAVALELRASATFMQMVESLGAARPTDRMTRTVYDGQGLVRFTVDAQNQVTEYRYEANGAQTATGPVRQTIQYAKPIHPLASYTVMSVHAGLAAAGLVDNAHNRQSHAVLDSADRLAYSIDAAGAITGYSYDVMGRVVKTARYESMMMTGRTPTKSELDRFVQDASGMTRIDRSYYDDSGALRFSVDAEGYVTRNDYDAEGRVIRTARFAAAVAVDDTTTIDAVALLAVGAQVETRFEYDPAGRLAVVYDGEGGSRNYSYYANGTLEYDIAMLGSPTEESRTRFEYDATGRVSMEHRAWGTPEQATTKFWYDGHGDLIRMEDPNGNPTSRTYDRLGRMLTQTDAEGNVVRYDYDAFGDMVVMTDARGVATHMAYDRLGRMTTKTEAEGVVTGMHYTVFGELAAVTRGAATTSFDYDKLGRVVRTTDAATGADGKNYYEAYKLNAFGERVEVTNKLGGITVNQYNARGLLTHEFLPMTSTDADNILRADRVLNRFEYDARGNRTLMVEADNTPEKRTTIYRYDRADRLVETLGDAVKWVDSVNHDAQVAVAPSERINYDRRGNVIETFDANGARTLFYYDKLNRKVLEIDALGTYSTWAYDKNGNISASRVYGVANAQPGVAGGATPLTPGGEFRETMFAYDGLNRLKSSSIANLRWVYWEVDRAQLLFGTLTTSFDYDANGNLARTTGANGGTIHSYYDNLNRKTREVDQENYVTNWTYNAEGNVTEERRRALQTTYAGLDRAADPVDNFEDRVTQFEYDLNGRRTLERRLANGLGVQLEHDSVITYAYNGLGQVTRKVEATGDAVEYGYDRAGRLELETRAGYVGVEGAVSPTVRYTYDGLNNLTRTLQGGVGSAAERLTRNVYGAGGRLETQTNAAGAVFTHAYGLAGNKMSESWTRETNEYGLSQESSRYRRDILGRTIGQTVAFYRADPGLIMSEPQPQMASSPSSAQLMSGWIEGDVQTTEYNAYGEVSARGLNVGIDSEPSYSSPDTMFLYEPVVAQERFDYDAAGRLSRSTTGDGVWRYFYYDKGGNQSLVIENEGRDDLVDRTHEDALQVTAGGFGYGVGDVYIDGLNTSMTAYDKRGRATETILAQREVDGTIRTLRAARGDNAFGELAFTTDYRGNKAEYAYNTMGRNTSITRPMITLAALPGDTPFSVKPVELFYYDKSGRMVGTRDANGNVSSRTLLAGTGYGGGEALVASERHADDGTVAYDYDVFGDLRGRRDEIGRIYEMSYDGMGRLTFERNANGLTEAYTYDVMGQRLTHSDSFHADVERTDYDQQGRIITQVAFGGDTTRTSYFWDSNIRTDGMGHYGGWVQSVTQANGRRSEMKMDVFGRDVSKVDLGGNRSTFRYDQAGRQISRTTGAETFDYAYFNTGLLAEARNVARNDRGAYVYDADGNRTSEYLMRSNVVRQNARATYDTLGRLATWNELGGASTPAASIINDYDANGNIRRTRASFARLDVQGNVGAREDRDHWYVFDSMNRVVLAKGVVGTMADSSRGIVRGATGNNYSYDKAGQRMTASRGLTSETREIYSYSAGGQLSAVRVIENATAASTGPGRLVADFAVDPLGRTTLQQDYSNVGKVVFSRQMAYNAKGSVDRETVITVQGTTTLKSEVYYDYGADGNEALGAPTLITTENYKLESGGYRFQGRSSTTNRYAWYDSAVTASSAYDSNTLSNSNAIFTNSYSYSSSGEIRSVTITDGRPRTINFVTDFNGQVIDRDEADRLSGGDPREIWYRYNGRQMGYVGNNGTSDTDYAMSIAARTATPPTSTTGAFRNGASTSTNAADFDGSLDQINSFYQGAAGGSYLVQTGDTLQGIAAALWGDPALWYKLAEANGLTATSPLNEGQRLTIPSGVLKNTHNADTFKPYDASEAIGDTSPTNAKPAKKNKCGAFGQILLIAVAVAVSIVSYGALTAPASGLLAGGGFANAVAAGALAGAAGSVASQGVGLATGIQDRFSFKGVALAAIGGGVGGGVGVAFPGGGIAGAAFRGVVGSAIGQGIGVATGLQKKFDWAGVAAAGIGAGIGAGLGSALGTAGSKFAEAGQRLATSAADAIANAATRSVLTGSDFGDNLLATLPAVIGNTVGNIVGQRIADRLETSRQDRTSVQAGEAAKQHYRDQIEAMSAEKKAFYNGNGIELTPTAQGIRLEGYNSTISLAAAGTAGLVSGTDGDIVAGENGYRYFETSLPQNPDPGLLDLGGLNFQFSPGADGIRSDYYGFQGGGVDRVLSRGMDAYLYTTGTQEFQQLGVRVSYGPEVGTATIQPSAMANGPVLSPAAQNLMNRWAAIERENPGYLGKAFAAGRAERLATKARVESDLQQFDRQVIRGLTLGPQLAAEAAVGGLVIRGLGRLLPRVASGLGRQNPLYKAALQQYGNTSFTVAGRALTKHPEVIGATKETLRQTLRSDASINRAAQTALKDILRNGTTTRPILSRYGQVTQTQVPGGYGARWYADGRFIGFINP